MSAQKAQQQLATLGVPARQATENLRRFAHHAGSCVVRAMGAPADVLVIGRGADAR